MAETPEPAVHSRYPYGEVQVKAGRPARPAGSAVTVAGAATGLRPGTTYRYGVVVIAPDGTAKAQDRTFKTKARPALSKLAVKPVGIPCERAGATVSDPTPTMVRPRSPSCGA